MPIRSSLEQRVIDLEALVASLGVALTDGDKGDVIVSSSGTVWTLDAAATNEIVNKDYSNQFLLMGA
jgi:hypothetical protein